MRAMTHTFDRLLTSAALAFCIIVSACSSQPAGCGSDNDCKGDRICEASQCVEPKKAPAVASTPNETVKPNVKDVTKTDGKKPAAAAPENQAPLPALKAQPAPRLGAKEPLVVITEFGDFQCSFCRRSTALIRALIQQHGKPDGVLAYEWRHNPLTSHAHAKQMAIAAAAAHQQNHFWQMHDQLFGNTPKNKAPAWDDYARKAGVDVSLWNGHRRHPLLEQRVQKERETALTLGAKGTPAFFINGRLLLGFQDAKTFEKELKAELVKANALLAKGTERAEVAETLEKTNNPAFFQALRSAKVQASPAPKAPSAAVQ